MANDLTELVFVLDKSGSMSGLESDSIGGYNSMLKKQQAQEGRCRITSILFDHEITVLHDRLDIRAVSPLTEKDYCPGGCTALLDAIGCGISKIASVQKHSSEEFRASKVLFVIITDGLENSSREFSSAKIKSMIQHEKEKYGWEFIFLGANIDAVETASHIGISADRACDYVPDAGGTALNYMAMSQAVSEFRRSGRIAEAPLAAIREDAVKRRKR